jgi:hypothetical protein
VQVGIHGSSLFNAFFMPLHSSVVEIRPYGFSGEWPNAYMKARARAAAGAHGRAGGVGRCPAAPGAVMPAHTWRLVGP